MTTKPKNEHSKLLRKACRPPEHAAPRKHTSFTRGPCTGAQRAFDNVDRLLEQARAATCEYKKVVREKLGPSDERQELYILTLKEQRQVRRWWRPFHFFGRASGEGEIRHRW